MSLPAVIGRPPAANTNSSKNGSTNSSKNAKVALPPATQANATQATATQATATQANAKQANATQANANPKLFAPTGSAQIQAAKNAELAAEKKAANATASEGENANGANGANGANAKGTADTKSGRQLESISKPPTSVTVKVSTNPAKPGSFIANVQGESNTSVQPEAPPAELTKGGKRSTRRNKKPKKTKKTKKTKNKKTKKCKKTKKTKKYSRR